MYKRQTLEWLLFGMDVTMITQVILSSESFATNITVVGTLIRMSALMDQKVVGFGKFSVAVLANESLLWSGCSAGSSEQPWII